jgi:PAS domain S-box-containing protein
MSVRTKILIVICLTFLALLGILYFAARWFLLRDAVVTEQKSTTQDVTRLLAALDDEIAVLYTTVADWAQWDDTYAFISNGDTAYIDSNLPDSEFTSLGVELMLFINNSGQIVFGRMVDLESGAEIPIPESLYSQLQAGSRLLSHKDPIDNKTGVLSLPEGPMIISSQAIVTSQGEGPIRGTLIMGRRLDEAEIAKLSQLTQLLISAFSYNDDNLPGDVTQARNSLVGAESVFITPQSEKTVSGYTVINDVYGNPALIMRVDDPREAYAQAKTSMRYLGLALLAIGFVLGLVTMLLLERMVIIRLIGLNSSVMKIGSQGTASSRVEANGNDEIFALATNVNSMLDSIENSEAKERESGERFRSLYENATIGMYRTNPDGHILMANPALVSMLGYESFEGLSKRNLAAEGYEPENPRLEFQKLIERDGEVRSLESAWERKDGSIRYVRESARVVRDEKDQPLYYEGTVEDITEKRQAEEKLLALNAELEQRVEERTRALQDAQEQLVRQEKLAVLGQLAGGVGHELRNPLGVILNAIYYLKLVQPDANEKVRQYHGMIEQEVHNAVKIISDLLDFARIKSVEREPVSVPELVQRVLDRYPRPETILAKVKFPASLPKVFADPRQVEQVLGNLVVNAYQAMASNGMLTIQAVRRKKEIAIAVKDTGMGIPPENMKKLFEPLFTTKINGIGLGLAVSKKLAEANGGRIEVQSEPGKGSTFTLVLSVHEVER